jgi:dolichyl-phosphate beta-glucosyltransferase
MMAARGQLLLFADADGATPIDEANRLRAGIERGADIAVGSRLISDGDVRHRRSWWRGLIGRGFAEVTQILLKLPIRDTQCGFKMFRHDVGKLLFGLLKEDGFLFDLELLILADQRGYRMVEVPVNWCEKSGGHFHWSREFWRVARGLRRLHGKRSALPHREPTRHARGETLK